MTAKTNELPPGAYGRHLFVTGDWSGSIGSLLDAERFPMATFEGNWGDCAFFETHGKAIRWLRIVNAQKRVDGVCFLPRLETLLVGFEPKSLSPLLKIKTLRSLEIIAKVPAALLCHATLDRLKISGATKLNVDCENGILRELFLDRAKLSSMQELRGLRSLQTLDIYGAKGLSNLDGIEHFPALEILGIEACPQLTDLRQLVSARSLRKLSIVRSPVGELPNLAHHPALQFLHIGGQPVRVDWESLFSCKSLTDVAILVPQALAAKESIIKCADKVGRTIDEFSVAGGKDKFIKLKLART